jgi:putative oxidoreductase
MKAFMDLLARLCISAIFFYEAYDTIAFAKSTKVLMTSYGITWRQDMLLYGAMVALVLGSFMILLGYRSGLGATLLLLYWVPVTLIVHSFWNDPIELRREHSIHFMKNVAILGGLLSVWVNGSGKISIRRLFATSRVRGA